MPFAARKLRSKEAPDGRAASEPRYVAVAVVLLLLALTAVYQWPLLHGRTIIGIDSATQFYPWYSYLGESLRSGEIPAWDPHLFSGAPFAGDPLSGWTYLPAMILFTLLPLAAAAKTYMFVHPLLAGLFTYALGRALRMNVAGALLAAVAYEFSGYLYIHNTCCFAYASVLTWLPLAILGVELAIQSSRWRDRGLWWGVAGLGLSQILASWLGQGSYYALLALGGYVAYRTLLSPPDALRRVHLRFLGLFLHGGAVLAFGFGLAAAGILPRLEYIGLSNLAGGYSRPAGGWTLDKWSQLLAEPGGNYLGAAALALALAAPLIARRRFAVPYFAVLALCALTLSGKGFTLLHAALYLLPEFEKLHQHFPQRAISVFYLGAALLAGATLTELGCRGARTPSLAVPLLLAAAFLATRSTLIPPIKLPKSNAGSGLWEAPMRFLLQNGVSLLPGAFFVLIFVLLAATAYALMPRRFTALRGICATLVALAVFVDLFAAGTAALKHDATLKSPARIAKTNLKAYYAPTAVTRLLQSSGKEPFRYVSYSPWGGYNMGFEFPQLRALEAENRAILWDGMQSVQGYNAVHLARYGEYLKAMNGQPQNYHGANVLSGGLDSPLLNLLNVRYIVVPSGIPPASERNLIQLERDSPIVYEDPRVTVLKNKNALPRAWVVHSAYKTKPEEALKLLASGTVDPRKTALLEKTPPDLAKPSDSSKDQASVTSYGANTIKLKTTTGAKGLLMLSEVYYPAWKAYVDGKPAPLYRADQLLRAIPVPAGKHEVELSYESSTLRLGLAISSLTALTLVALIFARLRRPRLDKLTSERPRGDDS